MPEAIRRAGVEGIVAIGTLDPVLVIVTEEIGLESKWALANPWRRDRIPNATIGQMQ